MKLAIPKEIRDGETRVAISPDTIKKWIGLGADVTVQAGAGEASMVLDDDLVAAGATIAADAAETYRDADIVLKVRRPMTAQDGTDELAMIPKTAILAGLLSPLENRDDIQAYADAGLCAFSMELVPRISRAQTMDALSSQSNLAGYRAVIDAAAAYSRIFPMMMTAAGSIAPAKVLVLGAGVAGLQAIATAKRLGAIVSAFDVRPAVKEQVESLGAKFVEVESEETDSAETAGGYAREMSEDYKRKQRELIHETVKGQDVVITTALIPGRPAPELITEDMVKEMKTGSVIVDLAVDNGGNCPLSEPNATVVKHGVTIIGEGNLAGRVPVDASAMYARNLFNFISPMIDPESKTLNIDWEDEVIAGALVTKDGAVVHPALTDGGA